MYLAYPRLFRSVSLYLVKYVLYCKHQKYTWVEKKILECLNLVSMLFMSVQSEPLPIFDIPLVLWGRWPFCVCNLQKYVWPRISIYSFYHPFQMCWLPRFLSLPNVLLTSFLKSSKCAAYLIPLVFQMCSLPRSLSLPTVLLTLFLKSSKCVAYLVP